MALALFKLQRLQSAGLTEFYEQHEDLWREMAEQAFAYTKGFVEAAGEAIRQDDVVPVLKPALDVCDPLQEYLEEKRLSQKFWYLWFGELIIDRLFDELTAGEQ